MTRVWTDGAESGDMLFMSAVGGCGISSAPANGMTGAYCYGFQNNTGPSKSISPALSEFYFRFRYMQNTGNTLYFYWYSGGVQLGYIAFNSRFTVSAGSLSAVTPTYHNPGTTYLIELHLKLADAPNGILQVKINGLLEVDLTGDTKPGAQTTVDQFYWAGRGDTAMFLDDLALNDTAGTEDNSWCGNGYVIALLPNANGDVNQLVGSDANSIDNYLLVDERPSNGDTDYVEGSVVDERDLYNLGACGLTTQVIKRVFVETRSKDVAASSGKLALGIKTGDTEYYSPDITLGSAYMNCRSQEWLLNPQTGLAWTPSELDALQLGIKTRS